MDRSVALGPLWDRVWARRRAVFTFVFITTLLTLVVVFLLPPQYKAETELLPPGEDDSGIGLASLLRGVGLPGVKIPTPVSAGDIFMAVLESRRVNEQMVDRFDLKRLYKVKFMADAVKERGDHAKFKQTEGGTIQISVVDRDRQRAADMANAYVELLDRFNRDVRMTKGRRTRMFIEGRLRENREELAAAEDRLAAYQIQHKAVVITPQMSSAAEEAAKLYARRMALQVRLGVVRSYSVGSEEEIQLREELSQLGQQMKALPENGMELGRLLREAKVQEQVFAILTAQYEDARINEARDIVTVEVLDPAKPPEKKAGPRRGLITGIVFLMSLTMGAGYALYDGREQPRPQMRAVAGD